METLPANTFAVWSRELRKTMALTENHAKALRDPEELSILHEATTDLIGSLERQIIGARALRDRLTARLEAEMGDGEAIVCPSTGRIAYIGPVSDGRAQVVAHAVDELGESLPDDLRARSTWKYPTVTAFRAAKKRRIIDRETFEAVVDEPPSRMGLRWRTLEDDAGGEA